MQLLIRPSSCDTNGHAKFVNLLCTTFDKWICCNEMEPSQSHEKKQRKGERGKEGSSFGCVLSREKLHTY